MLTEAPQAGQRGWAIGWSEAVGGSALHDVTFGVCALRSVDAEIGAAGWHRGVPKRGDRSDA